MNITNSASNLTALLVLSLVGCGDDASTSTTAPKVTASSPADGATGVAINGSVSATFSEEMDPASLTAGSFKLTSGTSVTPILGTVIYADSTAVFWPAVYLPSDTSFTATITTDAMSDAGVSLEAMHAWTFQVGSTVAPGLPVKLGTASKFVILAKSAVSTVPTSAVTGDIGVSPAAATYITGFSMTADATNKYATAPQVTGKIYAANYASPTPANMTKAISDMELAFIDAAGRAADHTELGAGNIGGMTLAAGVYKWGTGLQIPTTVTLNGSATDVWVFQIAQNLTMASAQNIVLSGGALAQNVFWQVAGKVELGTTAHMEGVVMSKTSITLKTGASIKGRLLAQTAVSIDGSAVVQPGL